MKKPFFICAMIFDSAKFSKDIKVRRTIDNDLSMDAVAKKTKVSKATLSRLEHGKTPDIKSYAKICGWLGVKMEKYLK